MPTEPGPAGGPGPGPAPIRFTGTARDYFGIWLNNLALTVLTLGVYGAWAKVRRTRYFLGNTVVLGDGILLPSLLVVGADETLMEELAALAAAAGSAGYSRGFERDAAAVAQSLLAAALRALRRHCGDSCRDDRGWFSTHPAFEDRIEALERRR